MNFVDSPPPSSSPKTSKPSKPKGTTGPASFVDLEITNMRRTIAKRLLQSKVRMVSSI